MAEGGQPTSSDQTEETNDTVRLCTHLESVESSVQCIKKSLRKNILKLENANDKNNCALHHCTIDVTDLLKNMEEIKCLQEKLKIKTVEHIDHHRERSVREEERWNYFNRNSTSGNVLGRCGCNHYRCRGSDDSGFGSNPQSRLNPTNEELKRSGGSGFGSNPQSRLNSTNEEYNRSGGSGFGSNPQSRLNSTNEELKRSADSGIGSNPQSRLIPTNEELDRSALRETNITDLDPLSLTERLDAMNGLDLHSSESLQQQHQQQQRVATECDDTASKFMARE